jgi:hypothetical protein
LPIQIQTCMSLVVICNSRIKCRWWTVVPNTASARNRSLPKSILYNAQTVIIYPPLYYTYIQTCLSHVVLRKVELSFVDEQWVPWVCAKHSKRPQATVHYPRVCRITRYYITNRFHGSVYKTASGRCRRCRPTYVCNTISAYNVVLFANSNTNMLVRCGITE